MELTNPFLSYGGKQSLWEAILKWYRAPLRSLFEVLGYLLYLMNAFPAQLVNANKLLTGPL